MANNSSKVFGGRLYTQRDDGVFVKMPISMDEARDAANKSEPVELIAIEKGLTADGKSVKCAMPVMTGKDKMDVARFDLPLDECPFGREAAFPSKLEGRCIERVKFKMDGFDSKIVTLSDKSRVMVTGADLKSWNEAAREFHAATKEANKSLGTEAKAEYQSDIPSDWIDGTEPDEKLTRKEQIAARMELLEKEGQPRYGAYESTNYKIADTVPYGNGSKDSKSTLADKYPETQAMLNAKWDRHNVDAALGLSEESQSDGVELE